jgi:iron complex outermembrane recepter protein
MHKNRIPLSFSLSVLALSIQAMTQTAAAQTPVVELDEVVVSGSRSATKLSETPVSIGAVKSSQWEQDKPKSVGEIINRIAGVHWNDLGNEQHSMAIRQPISTNAMYQYLEDGIPIRPLGVFNHNALNETNMNGSEGVEVVKGAASSLFGSNAVGGAVNFLSKKPSATPTGTVGLRIDNVDKFKRIDTGASNTWGDLGLRFSHYSSERDSTSWQQYSGGKKDSFTLRADYDLSATSWLRASIVQTDLFAETPGSVTEADYRSNPGKSINTFTWRKDKMTRANLAWEGETTENGVTTATVFYRNNDHGQLPNYMLRSCSGNKGACTGEINNNHLFSHGLDIKHEQNLDWLQTKWVSGVYIDRTLNKYVKDNLAVVREPFATGKNLSYTVSDAQTGRRDYAVDIANDAIFTQLEVSPLDAVRVVLGARNDSITYDFKNNLTPGPVYGAPNESRSFSRLSVKLGATWALSPSQSVYANISQGFTPPEVSQLYGSTAIPNLKPAIYENREIGWRALYANKLRVESALYQLDGTDTIVTFKNQDDTTERRNAGKTLSEGLELSLSQEHTAWDWQLGANFSRHAFVDYNLGKDGNLSGNSMAAAPWHTLNATLGYRIVPNARIAVNLVKQSEYYMNDANTAVYEGHTLLNLTGSYQMNDGWEGWFQVRNLTDQLYANNTSVGSNGKTYGVGAPRSLMVGITKFFGKK